MAFPLHHVAVSPSPVFKAFSYIEWAAPSVAVSKPEQSMLKNAEANPIEYTMAEFEDAFAYARLLLKVLDQVTGPSNPGRVSELTLEDPTLSDDEALEYLEDDKPGVVTHYLVSQLYDMMGYLKDRPCHSQIQISTLFYQNGALLDDWRPLLRLLYRQGDPFSQRGAALCLMYILQAGCASSKVVSEITHSYKVTMVEETLQSLVSWLTSRLQSSHSTSLAVVTPTLVVLGTCPQARLIFDSAGGVGYLARHLRPKASSAKGSLSTTAASTNTVSVASRGVTARRTNGASASSPIRSSNKRTIAAFSSMYSTSSAQQLYELLFCLWTMVNECMEHEEVRNHFARDGAVVALSELLAAAPREKVLRLALNSLRQLAEVDPRRFVPEMMAYRVLKHVELLRGSKEWKDEDIVEDLDRLHKILTDGLKDLTKWEVYQAELESGVLKDGLLHSEQFFKANAMKMEGPNGDFCHVKRLIQLITLREEDETVGLACYDLGEFIRHYPNGKAIAKRIGAKEAVMPLLQDHESMELQQKALQCISKLLVNNWQAVTG